MNEIRTGRTKIYFLEKDNGVEAICDCNYWPDTLIRIPMTAEQAQELSLGRRRSIQEVLPTTPAAIREIFISGSTPAEFDEMMGSKLCDPEDPKWPVYRKEMEAMGYEFGEGYPESAGTPVTK